MNMYLICSILSDVESVIVVSMLVLLEFKPVPVPGKHILCARLLQLQQHMRSNVLAQKRIQ